MCVRYNGLVKIFVAFVCGVFCLPGAAIAEEAAQPAPTRVSEIVITATRTERELFDVPSSMSVVTSQQMSRSPQRTIAEQLRDIPGLQVSDGGVGGGAKRISIRGEGASRVLVLIDGMKISEQKSMDGSMLLIGPENIERIEVIKGASSVLYGSEAIGGVINIITKKGGDKPIQGTFVTTYDGSNSSLTPYASLYGAYQGFGYRFSGDYTDAENKRAASGRLDGTSYMQRNYSGYLDYSWAHGKAGFGYDHFWSNNNVPPATATEGRNTVVVSPDLPLWQRDRFYTFIEQGNISEFLQKIKLTAFTQKTKKDFANTIDVLNVRMGPFMYDVETRMFTVNEQRSYGGTLQSDWTFGESHYVVAGIDYLQDTLKSSEDRAVYRIRQTTGARMPAADNGSYHSEAYQKTLALFLQDEWQFHEDWTATLGLRSTWVWSALDKTNDRSLATSRDSDSKVVGHAALVYSGFEDWRLRANYSQGYRYPSLHHLYMGTVHGSADITYPNAGLKPETSHSFEVGARYDANNFKADLSTYYTKAKDYIYRGRGEKNRYEFRNSNKAETFGTELELAYTFASLNLTPYMSGAYMHRTYDRGSDGGGSTSHTGDPRWTGRTGLRYEKEFSPEFSLHTDAFLRMASNAKEQDNKGIVTKKGGWTTANVAIGAKFGKDKKLFADLNLNNITNKKYTQAASSLEDAGFHTVLRIGMEF